MTSSPTARALAFCRKQGWLAGIVEKWNQHAMKRFDLFGFIDLVVLDQHHGPLGVQVTSTGNMSARLAKIRGERSYEALRWLESGGRIQIWGYARRGAAGKRKLWKLKRWDVVAEGQVLEKREVMDGP